jgi:hypothetical protein
MRLRVDLLSPMTHSDETWGNPRDRKRPPARDTRCGAVLLSEARDDPNRPSTQCLVRTRLRNSRVELTGFQTLAFLAGGVTRYLRDMQVCPGVLRDVTVLAEMSSADESTDL